MQIDPLADQFPGWTPYHYVHSNPLNLIDPTGMAAEDCLPQCGDQLYNFLGSIYEVGRALIPNKSTKSISVETGVGDPEKAAAGVKVTHTETTTSDENGASTSTSNDIDGVVHIQSVTIESGTSGNSVNLNVESRGRYPGVDITVSDQGVDTRLQQNVSIGNFDFAMSGGYSDGGYIVGGGASYTKVNESTGTYRRVETTVSSGGGNIFQRIKSNMNRYFNNF